MQHFFCLDQKFIYRAHLCTPFPCRLLLLVFGITFNWELLFKIKIQKSLRLPCYGLLRFTREIEIKLILSRYINIMGASEGNAVYALLLS